MLALSLAIPKKNNEIFLILPCTEIQFLSERWKNVVDWPPSMGLLSTGDVRWIQLFSLIACWPLYQRYIREPLDTAIISEREKEREYTNVHIEFLDERERERRGGKKKKRDENTIAKCPSYTMSVNAGDISFTGHTAAAISRVVSRETRRASDAGSRMLLRKKEVRAWGKYAGGPAFLGENKRAEIRFRSDRNSRERARVL